MNDKIIVMKFYQNNTISLQIKIQNKRHETDKKTEVNVMVIVSLT